MAEPAIRRMTVDDFLRWEDGTDTRYELVDGSVMAMAPPTPRHGTLVLRLGGAIDAALRARPPCAAHIVSEHNTGEGAPCALLKAQRRMG
jgi:Uma2 family endonuclease